MWRLMFGKIDPVQCAKVTAGCVWPVERNGRRESRATDWFSYHETWADAHAAMLAKAEQDMYDARRKFERAQGEYDRIKGIKAPLGHSGGGLT